MKYDKLQDVLQNLTTEDKLQLTTGDGSWHTANVSRLEVRPVTLADGPVGLRKEHLTEDGTVTLPAVALPSISKLACSFDPALLKEVGSAIGEQCRAQAVDVILAPGLNIKRNPLCGRNFEYFSEDPMLTAELGAAYVNGVHSQNVGVCLKHFAGNSQDYGRRVCDSVIDERALREIYLSAFERIVKECKPEAVMCAYNKLNGEYCSQNKRLLTEILRNDWGFDGVVMSDWGATDDRVKGIAAGLDLQMPEGDLEPVRRAHNDGSLWESDLDQAVSHVVQFSRKFQDQPAYQVNFEAQHKLCRRWTPQCTVLVKNNCNLLPFKTTDDVALIGALAQTPHFQGGGSSKVFPYKVESIQQGFEQLNAKFQFAEGYRTDGADEQLLAQAQQLAAEHDKVLLVVGDYGCESEGFDREDFQLPAWQLEVIDAVTSANSNVAVVVQSGAPVDLSWHHGCKALLLDYLPGENGAGLADVVFGKANPNGRLAETWPNSLADKKTMASSHTRALYSESIFVGYRYYTSVDVEVAFPFGYGLNYNTFNWTNVKLSAPTVLLAGKLSVTLEVENLGKTEDADTVQVYLTNLDGRTFYAKRNLVAFKKVWVKGRDTKKVTIPIDVSSFASYDVQSGTFAVNGGKYLLTVARNANDAGFPLQVEVSGENNSVDTSETLSAYHNLTEQSFTEQNFALLYGRFPDETVAHFSRNTALADVTTNRLGKFVARQWTKDRPDKKQLLALPLIDFVPLRPNLSAEMVDTVVDMLNGAFFQNLFRLFKQWYKHRSACKNKQK